MAPSCAASSRPVGSCFALQSPWAVAWRQLLPGYLSWLSQESGLWSGPVCMRPPGVTLQLCHRQPLRCKIGSMISSCQCAADAAINAHIAKAAAAQSLDMIATSMSHSMWHIPMWGCVLRTICKSYGMHVCSYASGCSNLPTNAANHTNLIACRFFRKISCF